MMFWTYDLNSTLDIMQLHFILWIKIQPAEVI